MKLTLSLDRTLESVLWSTRPYPFFPNFMLVVFTSFIIGMLARIEAPTMPNTISLFALGVLLAGMACGAARGSYAVIAYLIEGLVGMEVYIGQTWGWRELIGENAGYLWGGIVAALIAGLLVERGWGRYVTTSALAAVIGLAIYHLCGLLVASLFIDWPQLMAEQLRPSLGVDLFIVVLLACLVPVLWISLESE